MAWLSKGLVLKCSLIDFALTEGQLKGMRAGNWGVAPDILLEEAAPEIAGIISNADTAIYEALWTAYKKISAREEAILPTDLAKLLKNSA